MKMGFSMNKLKIFESLLQECKSAVERTIFFRISSRADAEDVLQEVYLMAYRKFETLTDPMAFKAWLIRIAQNKCIDYYRRKAARAEFPMDISERVMVYGRCGLREQIIVREIMDKLADKDRNILKLYYFKELSQAEIAKKLNIPVGTVKSRLYTARENFRRLYPVSKERDVQKAEKEQKNISVIEEEAVKEAYVKENYVKKLESSNAQKKSAEKESGEFMNIIEVLPEILPEYTITPSKEAPFEVIWEELQGWMIVPRQGEKLIWGLYELPSRKRTEYTELEVIGAAEVHGIKGVEIAAVQYDAENYYRTGSVDRMERRFVAQLTDTHSRYLAESHVEDGVRKCYTFLDGDSFMKNWGFGEDNCGNKTHITVNGVLQRTGNQVSICTQDKREEPENNTSKNDNQNFQHMDVVGRYTVTIAEKTYDTICMMDVESFDDAIATESYLDKNGRTVLWRRFNRNDWAIEHFGNKNWSEMFPDNEKLIIDGKLYVHWYDCISDYIMKDK